MRRLTFLAVAAAICAATWLSASAAPESWPVASDADYVMPQSQEKTLDITMMNKPGLPPHIAVPPFVVLTADQATQDASRGLTEVLSADLKFEREFDVMPAASYVGVPSAQTIEALPFERWTQLGADFVALGTVKAAPGGKFEVEILVVSMKERRQSYGAQVTGSNLRRLAHTISDGMHKTMRAVDGVAMTRIAFSSTRDGERYGKTVEERSAKEIYIMDYDGANQQKVTANHSLNISASWCPDGQCLAYMTYQSGYPDIVLQNIFGQIGRSNPAHGSDSVHNYLPRISPDGTKIAYGSTLKGNAMDIYVVNRDGTNERRLTNNAASEGSPAWSPSGNLLAFTSDRTGTNNTKIYTMNADGTGLKRIENDCSHCDRPTFAPGLNGLLLAYSTQTGGGNDIEFYDLNNGQARRLTNGEGTNESPSFAPNGRHVLFVTTRWGKEQLAVVDIDGKNVRRLTELGANTYPNWSGFLK